MPPPDPAWQPSWANLLYDLASDLSETRDRSADQPEMTTHLTQEMQTCIDHGRSTSGPAQPNEANLSLQRKAGKGAKKKARGPGR